jgi:hypothetical protein
MQKTISEHYPTRANVEEHCRQVMGQCPGRRLAEMELTPPVRPQPYRR